MSYKHIITLKGLTLDEIKDFCKNDTRYYLRVKKYDASPICALCGGRFNSIREATLDHIVPRSAGGRTREFNTRLAHKKCNSARGCTPENYPGWLLDKAFTPMVKNTPRVV